MSTGIPGASDQRRYKRLDHIFPVELRFVELGGEWREAYTQDIGPGGLCIVINQLNDRDLELFSKPTTRLALNINIPSAKKPCQAKAHPAWIRVLKEGLINQYSVGLEYEEIDAGDNYRMLSWADRRRIFKASAIVFILFLGISFFITGFYSMRLRYQNEKLLAGMTDNLVRQRNLEKGSKLLELKIDEMNFLLSQSSRRIDALERVLVFAKGEDKKRVSQLEGALDFFKKYQVKLKEDISGLMSRQAQVVSDTTARRKEAVELEKRVSQKFLVWLSAHQNNQTGLVTSFEGDGDVADWAFTYDQALASIAFTFSDDPARSRRILDFYLNARKTDDGAFVNAYYASSGDVAEFIAHTGPNIWLGIAALHYNRHFNDARYLSIARDVLRWLEAVRDQESGHRGSKSDTWYSTEHNLDAYAFYKMFHEVTGDQEAGRLAAQTLSWLNANAYSRLSCPVKRGKGDSTIATDTFAWSIAAVGPEELKKTGMDPDAIMDFAIANCGVTVDYKRPEGYLVSLKGFDFSKAANVGRGGVVSGEWTAQMILSMKLMADYNSKLDDTEKESLYRRLADDYIIELSKMIITSPSPVGQGEFCLPYASHEFADTGHGWRTPKGNRTGSVAATAYAIFALEGSNPLSLNGKTP